MYIDEIINTELKRYNMAYKIQDKDGNIFVYGGLDNEIPWYRGISGSKHIFSMDGYEVLEYEFE